MGCLSGDGGQKAEAKPLTSPEQQAAQKAVNAFVLPRIGTGATPFTGELVAGASDFALDALEQFKQTVGSGFESTRDFLESLAGGDVQREFEGTTFEPTERFDPKAIAAEFRTSVAEPLLNVFNDILLPQIEESFNLPGAFNTTLRGQGVSRAGSEFVDRNISPRLFDAQQAGRQRAFQSELQAQSLTAQSGEAAEQRNFGAFTQAQGFRLPAIGALQGQSASQLGQVLAGESFFRDIEQNKLSAAYQEFLRTSPEADPFTQLALGFAFKPTTENVVFTEPDRVGQLIGAAGTAAGIGAGIALSDINMKENIIPIEAALSKVELLSGYTYNYIDEDPESRHGGIMAQDLERVLPDAVTINEAGVRYVRIDAVVGLLVNAVKELNDKVKEL